MMLRGTQINYMPDKSHVIIITIKYTRANNTNHVAGCKFHLQPALCSLAREKERFRDGSLSIGRV